MSDRTTGISRETVEREWHQRGYTCDLWVDPPGTVWSDFVHDADEVLLLLDGDLLLEIDGRVVRLERGDEFEIPAGTRHTVRNVGSGTARWLYGYRAS